MATHPQYPSNTMPPGHAQQVPGNPTPPNMHSGTGGPAGAMHMGGPPPQSAGPVPTGMHPGTAPPPAGQGPVPQRYPVNNMGPRYGQPPHPAPGQPPNPNVS